MIDVILETLLKYSWFCDAHFFCFFYLKKGSGKYVTHFHGYTHFLILAALRVLFLSYPKIFLGLWNWKCDIFIFVACLGKQWDKR